MKTHSEKGRPFLLGYSGGPDSKALLYLLLECRRALRFELCIAHLDHGWREKSGEEAEAIAAEIQGLGLQLFIRRLEGKGIPQRNGEAAARCERIQFFQKVYKEIQAQGLLLAHQADDQGETVLKRLLEGAHPLHWSAMTAEAKLEEMRVLRPLLTIGKKELANWLEKRGHVPLVDPTNLDSRFLRGRMRSEILPYLAEQFGKEISGNLCKAAIASKEIQSYLMKKCEPYWETLVQQEGKTTWDLSAVTELLEAKWLLKRWAENEQVHLSYEMIQTICESLLARRLGIQFPVKAGVIYLNCGILNYIKFR